MPRLRKPVRQQHKAAPPRPPVDLAALQHLPDWTVLDDRQMSAVTGLSEDVHRRLDALGEGVSRTELSARRHGRTVGNIKTWLRQRTPNGGPEAA
jgi:hypothetical protein